MKSEVGEMAGRIAVLLAENERLKQDCNTHLQEIAALREKRSEIETLMKTEYIQR